MKRPNAGHILAASSYGARIDVKPANNLLSGIGTTIFTVMSALATEHKSINLGQGFPDTDGPPDVVQAAADALHDGRNQYPPMPGVPELRQAVAACEPPLLRARMSIGRPKWW